MMRFIRAAALVPTFLAMSTLGAVAAPTLPLPPPRVHSMMMPPQESSLTVTGEGVVSKAPDEAKLSLRIVTDDANATISVSKNNDIRKALQSRLSFLNGARDVFHETGYSVQFNPFPSKNTPPEFRLARYGYVTTRSLVVTVIPIDLIGRAIDAATAAGVTNIGDVSFDLKDRHAAYLGALNAAMNDAKQQADALASAGSFHILDIRTVSTGYNAVQAPAPMAGMMQMRRAESAALTPTEIVPGGPLEVNARVSVTYAIK